MEDATTNREKLARYDALCQNPTDVVVVLDAEARYKHLSPSVESVLGYRSGEMIGRLCFDFYHPDDIPRIERITADGLADAKIPRPVVMRVRHKEGHYIWVEATASPVFSPNTGELVEILGVNRDISDRMRLEHELYEAQRAELVARLATSAAHDLNNILLMISTIGESLDIGLPEESELRTDAQAVSSAALSAGKLTRELLGLARPSKEEPRAFSANDVIEEVAATVSRSNRGVCRVQTRLDPSQPRLHGEPARLEQVLLNLALNACSAGEHTDLELVLSSSLNGDQVLIRCEDNGPGIAEELQDRIFEPFFTTRRNEGGTGIGLSTARRIVQGWGGSISVRSSLGEGATFTMSLPTAQAAHDEPPSPPGTHGRVLILEAQPAVRDALRGLLARLGYPSVCTTSEDQARRVFSEHKDIVLMIADGRSFGWEVARDLARQRATPRILMCGSDATPAEAAAGEVLLGKPFSSGDLTAAVRQLLGVTA